MKITVRVKEVYGKRLVYPMCPTAKLLANLARLKTFTPYAVDQIKALGYEIEVLSQQV